MLDIFVLYVFMFCMGVVLVDFGMLDRYFSLFRFCLMVLIIMLLKIVLVLVCIKLLLMVMLLLVNCIMVRLVRFLVIIKLELLVNISGWLVLVLVVEFRCCSVVIICLVLV